MGTLSVVNIPDATGPIKPATTATAVITRVKPPQQAQPTTTSPLATNDQTVPITTTVAIASPLVPQPQVQQNPQTSNSPIQTVIQTSNSPIQTIAILQTSATQIQTAQPAPISTGLSPGPTSNGLSPVPTSTPAMHIQSEDEVLTVVQAVPYSYALNGNLQTGVMTITTVVTPIVKTHGTTVIAGDPQVSNTNIPAALPVKDSGSKYSFNMVLSLVGFLLNFGISF